MQPNHLLMLTAMEKEAVPGLKEMAMSGLRHAGNLAGKAIRTPFAKTVADKARSMAASPVGKGVMGFGDDAAKLVKQKATGMADSAAPYVNPVANRVGQFGQAITTGTRKVLNKADDAAQWAMGGQNAIKAPGFSRWGDNIIGGTDVNPLSVRNLGVGAGGVAGAYEGGKAMLGGALGGGSAGADPVTQNVVNQTSTGGGGFLSGIPKEMQYALAAGVPLALLGAYMGGRGNMMGGLGLGALGLGAAGLGAAGAGYLGDDARRLVGQGAHSLMGLFGAGKDGDIMGQIKSLGRLSPEFGVTMLMGKNPGLSREEAQKMYEFLTQNQDSISKMLPAVTGAETPVVKAGAVMALAMQLDKAARCWKGYEAVPGKKPYSDNSCRPTGSKKKEKKAAEKLAIDPSGLLIGINANKPKMPQPPLPASRPMAMPTPMLPMRRPTMTQMPTKMPEMPVPAQDRSPMPQLSEGQQRAFEGMRRMIGQPLPQVPASPLPRGTQGGIAGSSDPYSASLASMIKTQSAEKEAFGGALLGAGARMAGKAIGSAVTKGLPMMARGAVQGAGKATSMLGSAAQQGGQMVANAGRMAGTFGEHFLNNVGQAAVQPGRNLGQRFSLNAAGALGGLTGMTGNAMQGLGGAAQFGGRLAGMAGQGLQQAGKHTATALPLAAAGAYGAYQAARPMLPNVSFQNPIADAGGVDVRPMRFQNPIVMK